MKCSYCCQLNSKRFAQTQVERTRYSESKEKNGAKSLNVNKKNKEKKMKLRIREKKFLHRWHGILFAFAFYSMKYFAGYTSVAITSSSHQFWSGNNQENQKKKTPKRWTYNSSTEKKYTKFHNNTDLIMHKFLILILGIGAQVKTLLERTPSGSFLILILTQTFYNRHTISKETAVRFYCNESIGHIQKCVVDNKRFCNEFKRND